MLRRPADSLSVTLSGPTSPLVPAPTRPRRPVGRGQRVFDVVAGSVLLVVLAPVTILAILAVKLTSRGPGIYSQVRLGRFGRPFHIYKIRSMTHNCEQKSGIQWCQKNDPRVTRIGWLLRKTHVDEFPQLINILRGQMSLVGPRPERPELIARLEHELPRYRDRLNVRPGLTGLAQVQLPPDTDLESVRRKLRYDLYYVARASVWMDLRLTFATAVHVMGLPFRVSRTLFGLPGIQEVEPELSDKSTFEVPASSAETAVHPKCCPTVHEVALDVARA